MGLVASALVASTALVFVLAALYPGLRFTSAKPAVPTSTPPPPAAPVASFTAAAESPAAKVVAALLGPSPAGLPGGLGPASSVTGTVSPAVALTCDRPVAPVLSRQRSWASGSGALGTGMTMTASVYSAGAGAEAMRAMRESRSECRKGIDVTSRDGVGVEALTASERVAGASVTSVLLRRGDVVVSLSGVRMSVPDELVADVDRRLDQLLSAPGVCPDQRAGVDAFARSLVAGKGFKGMEGTSAVPYPTTSGLPTLVVPSSAIALPPPVTATTPAEPYWPASAPAPVASPTAPVPVTPYPTVTSIQTPQQDTTGPGCGWSFTGMRAPTFDEAAAERTSQERAAAAIAAMKAAIDAYPGQALAYAAAWSAFERQAAAYAENNAEIAQIEAGWAIIRQQQADYAAAMAQYEADLKAYTDFAANQQAAQLAYQQALAECATMPPTPAASTPGTVPTTPTQPTAPSAATPTTPAAPPAATSAPTTGTSAAAPSVAPGRFAAAPTQCPPAMDPILTQMPPVSPVSPVPPPDPRPTPMPGATQ